MNLPSESHVMNQTNGQTNDGTAERRASEASRQRPRCIVTPHAPAPIGDAYCQAVEHGGSIFVSGQGGLTPNGRLLTGTLEQARQAIANVQAILEATGSDLRHVVRTTLYFADLRRDAPIVAGPYGEAFFFPDGYRPARMVFEVARPPLPGSVIWIDAVAVTRNVIGANDGTNRVPRGELR